MKNELNELLRQAQLNESAEKLCFRKKTASRSVRYSFNSFARARKTEEKDLESEKPREHERTTNLTN